MVHLSQWAANLCPEKSQRHLVSDILLMINQLVVSLKQSYLSAARTTFCDASTYVFQLPTERKKNTPRWQKHLFSSKERGRKTGQPPHQHYEPLV